MLASEVLEEVHFRVVQGFDSRESVFEWILANYPRQLGIAQQEYGAEDLDPATNAALRDAIERAFAEREREMESWPERTDHDRLRAAFAALDEQGIVALESPGLTQDDSISIAADLAIVRDELGTAGGHGYCFFTWNDMARAIDGEGLSLAYGTFEEDGQEVGAAVLKACRDAGLKAEWGGSPASFVEMPQFRWQRRLVLSQESDVRDFLESWELEIRGGYTPADEILQTFEERARDWFGKFSDFGPALRGRLRAHTVRLLDEEERREGTRKQR
jgi:hypothetical protein